MQECGLKSPCERRRLLSLVRVLTDLAKLFAVRSTVKSRKDYPACVAFEKDAFLWSEYTVGEVARTFPLNFEKLLSLEICMHDGCYACNLASSTINVAPPWTSFQVAWEKSKGWHP